MKIFAYGAMAAALAFSASLQAEPELLSSEEAFPLTVISSSAQEAELSWKMPPNYYLYQHKIEVRQGSQPVALQLPPAEPLHDENYGRVQVYYQQLQLHIPTQASQQYQVTWQGCAQDRVCYPPQSATFQTDASGLVSMQNQGHAGKRLLDLAGSGAQQNDALAPRDGAADSSAEAQQPAEA
ncbi:MAG: protein-disulfide reductase DsbD N-terminal domain-containing protein, partial [Acinetobacter sp.]|nr:protein-disulfide reductase DsbD N-terminal domain-containing protein [Acinetobacter sp.]